MREGLAKKRSKTRRAHNKTWLKCCKNPMVASLAKSKLGLQKSIMFRQVKRKSGKSMNWMELQNTYVINNSGSQNNKSSSQLFQIICSKKSQR
jgi:hypothetical protein